MKWLTKERKYYKPKSLTWWAAVVPLATGVLQASGLGAIPVAFNVISAIHGNVDAGMLINIGLAGIGLRGAIK